MRLPLLLLVGFLQFHYTGPFQVRLAGGPSGCAGRVEISYKGQWGSVCDDEWDLADATVVCRQLDCGTALSAPVGSWFGEGTGPVWLNEVRCKGSESQLQHCGHRGWRQHVCTHEEDASVVCSAHQFLPFTAEPSMYPTTGDLHPSAQSMAMPAPATPEHRGALLRLVGGPHSCAGRLEVLHGGQWGSVCDDGWGLPEGTVVCRELGCGAVQATPGRAHFGTGTGPIWLDDVGCSGKETSLRQCRARPWGHSNCQHDEDAGVICTGGAVLRLVGGAGPCSGRLEVFHQGRWGTVCDDRWALPSAAVVCRQLSCGDALSAPGGAFFGEGSGPIWLDNVRCQGNESALSQCLAAPWGVHDCQHAEDASVVCTDELAHAWQHPARPMAPQPRTQKPRTQKPRTQKPRMQKPRVQKPRMQKPRTQPPLVARKETQAPPPGSPGAVLAGKWKPQSLLEPTSLSEASQPQGTMRRTPPSGEPKLPAAGPTAQAMTHDVVGMSSPRNTLPHGATGTAHPILMSQQSHPEPLETHTDASWRQAPSVTFTLRTRTGALTDPHMPRPPRWRGHTTLKTVTFLRHLPSQSPSAQQDLTYTTPIPTPITTHPPIQSLNAWASLASPSSSPTPITTTIYPPSQPHTTWTSLDSPTPTSSPVTTHTTSQPHTTWTSLDSPTPTSSPITTHTPSQPHTTLTSLDSPTPTSSPITTHLPSQPHTTWTSLASPTPTSSPITTHLPSQPHTPWTNLASLISAPIITQPPSQPHSTWARLASPTPISSSFPTTHQPPIQLQSIRTRSASSTPTRITTHLPSQPHRTWTSLASSIPTPIPLTTHSPSQPHTTWTSLASSTPIPITTHPPSQPHTTWTSLASSTPIPITTHPPSQLHTTSTSMASSTLTPIPITTHPPSQAHITSTSLSSPTSSPITSQPPSPPHSAWTSLASPTPTSPSTPTPTPMTTQPPSQRHIAWTRLASPTSTSTSIATLPLSQSHSTWTSPASPTSTLIPTTIYPPRQPHSTYMGLASPTPTFTPILPTTHPHSQPHRAQTDSNFPTPITTQPLDETYNSWSGPALTSSSYTATHLPSQTHSTWTGLASPSQPKGKLSAHQTQCASSAVSGTSGTKIPALPGAQTAQTDAAPCQASLGVPTWRYRALAPMSSEPLPSPHLPLQPRPFHLWPLCPQLLTLLSLPPSHRPSTPPTPALTQEAVAMVWEPSRPPVTRNIPPVLGAGLGAVRGTGDCRDPGHESPQLRELIQVVRGLRGDLRTLVHIQRQEGRQLVAIASSLAELAGAVRQMVRQLPSPVFRGQSQLLPPAPPGQDLAHPTERQPPLSA